MEIRKSLETNFLTCKHCQQPYKHPKSLVCLHSFCQSCLEDIVAKRKAEEEAKELEAYKLSYNSTSSNSDYASGYRRKWSSRFRYGDYSTSNYNSSRYSRYTTKSDVIKCPLCQKETTLPSGGVIDLPSDQLADKLASMVDRMPNFPVCDVCTKEPLLNNSHLSSLISSKSNTPAQYGKSVYSRQGRYSSDEDSLSEVSEGEDEGVSLDKSSNLDSIDNSDSMSQQTEGSTHQNHSMIGSSRRNRRRNNRCTSGKGPNNGPRPASSACLECGKRLCRYCQNAHSRMPVTANHVLIHVEQMEELRCDRHPRELRRFFCLTCRVYICIICAFDSGSDSSVSNDKAYSSTGHADHDILSMRQAVAAYQDQLSLKSAETQTHIDRIETVATGLQVCETEMRQLRTFIEATAMTFIEQIQRQRDLLCEHIDNVLGLELEQLSLECEKLSNVTSAWYSFLNDDTVNIRLDLMDPIEALAEAGPMLDRVNRCLQLASNSMLTNPKWNPLLLQVKNAERKAKTDGYGSPSLNKHNCTNNHDENGHLPSQTNGNTDSSYSKEDLRVVYWQERVGCFEPGEVNLGRIITPSQLAAETKAKAAQFVNTHVQTGPELVKSLPPPKGALLHRAIQVDFLSSNLDDRGTQTDPVTNSNLLLLKIDAGTQYQSSDVNPPVSIYRSIKQILVQK